MSAHPTNHESPLPFVVAADQINDVLGNYSLTLVDTLDTLAMMGNWSEFRRGVDIVSRRVSFDQDSTVQVFEATIRVMGGLLSAHLIARCPVPHVHTHTQL